MKRGLIACVFFLLLAVQLPAYIEEVHHFGDLPKFVDDDTLVLLDIDDTLLIPVQTLGSDVWFQHRLQGYKDRGYAANEALEMALAEWEAIRHLTKVKLVEDNTDSVVKALQQKGLKVMALTTQGLALATRTVQQLKSLDIDVADSAPSQEDYYFINGQGVLYRQGILFTSGTNKGKALMTLLKQMDYHPKKIAFINDKLTHLKDVETAVTAAGITFIGLRYAYSDERVKNFNPEIADIQFQPFQDILSDENAAKALGALRP